MSSKTTAPVTTPKTTWTTPTLNHRGSVGQVLLRRRRQAEHQRGGPGRDALPEAGRQSVRVAAEPARPHAWARRRASRAGGRHGRPLAGRRPW